MAQPRSYRGVGLEQRVETRRAALIATGLDCLHEDGLPGVSVRSICARARLTPRYFYESFADLDDLLVAVVEAVAAEIGHAAVAAVMAAPDDLTARVRAVINATYGIVADDRRKANAILVVAAGHGPLVARRQQMILEYTDLATESLTALGVLSRTDRSAARTTALFLVGGTTDLIEAVLSGALRLSRARVVDRLTAFWVAVLSPA